MYWAGDKAQMLRGVLDRIDTNRDRGKRQVKCLLDILNIMNLKVYFTQYGRFIPQAWKLAWN